MNLWIRIAVSVGLLALIFVILPWSQVVDATSRVSPALWGVGVAAFVAGHALGVFKWRLTVNASRAGLGFGDAAMCYGAGLFANLCLPSIVGGDVLRGTLAARITNRPEAAVWGGLFDRLSDVAAIGLLVVAGGILIGGALPGWGGGALAIGSAAALTVGVLLIPFLFRVPLGRWPRRVRRHAGRSLVVLRRIGRTPSIGATVFLLSLTIQSSFVLLNAWLGRGLGIDVPLAVWFFAWPVAKLAGLVPISLGGLAVREATLASLLLPFGVSAALGVVVSLLWQAVLIGGGLIGGLLWWLLHHRRRTHFESGAASVTARWSSSRHA